MSTKNIKKRRSKRLLKKKEEENKLTTENNSIESETDEEKLCLQNKNSMEIEIEIEIENTKNQKKKKEKEKEKENGNEKENENNQQNKTNQNKKQMLYQELHQVWETFSRETRNQVKQFLIVTIELGDYDLSYGPNYFLKYCDGQYLKKRQFQHDLYTLLRSGPQRRNVNKLVKTIDQIDNSNECLEYIQKSIPNELELMGLSDTNIKQIFQYLDIFSLFRIAFLNKRLRKIIFSKKLWTQMDFQKTQYLFGGDLMRGITQVIQKTNFCRNFKKVVLSTKLCQLKQFVSNFLINAVNLEEITIHNCSSECFDCLRHSVKLKKLCIYGETQITDALYCLKNLETLDCQNYIGEHFCLNASKIQNLTNLTKINLPQYKYFVNCSLGCLSKLRSLTNLSVSTFPIELKRLTQLVNLTLSAPCLDHFTQTYENYNPFLPDFRPDEEYFRNTGLCFYEWDDGEDFIVLVREKNTKYVNYHDFKNNSKALDYKNYNKNKLKNNNDEKLSLKSLRNLKKIKIDNYHLFKDDFLLTLQSSITEIDICDSKKCLAFLGQYKMFPNLVTLKLNRCKIQTIPEEIGYLKSLIKLNLHSNRIKALPVKLFDLAKLESLNLNWNKIQGLPSNQMPKLKKLKKLKFNSKYEDMQQDDEDCELLMGGSKFNRDDKNKIPILPFDSQELKFLILLKIENNDLKRFPYFENHDYIEKILAKRNKIQGPIRFINCKQLTYIDLSFNEISEIHIENNPKLHYINFDFNQIKQATLENLPRMENIYFLRQQITSFDEKCFRNMPLLYRFKSWYSPNMKKMPFSFYQNKNFLYELSIENAQLCDINGIENFCNLVILSLKHNKIKKFPSFKKSKLRFLDLSGNEINSFKNFKDFPFLENLDLSMNNLRKLSKNIKYLHYLEKLELRYNKIKKIPKQLSKCRNLQVLGLYHNDLSKISNRLFKCPKLRTIVLTCNLKLRSIPTDVRKDANKLLSHFKTEYHKEKKTKKLFQK
ncbi:s-cell enriched with leucine-rich repeat-containing protein slra-related [Anaeramoeba flamelloides]|uniref:S-cell enriched with leucine-rich repeat-containing protein slra-related n=1 Tax=Anaeramoeba flamelloides TaxID=1746091 RepID=A0AAV7Z1U6_9EUKA|nr:s-cell enriched with leucine-rich repeat-containing protein slra-related [Anaeramoeba flamelloides]